MKKHLTVVWKGDEPNIEAQINHLKEKLKSYKIETHYTWKDSALQERVLNYSGVPIKNKYANQLSLNRRDLRSKYMIITYEEDKHQPAVSTTTEEVLAELNKLRGKKFDYYTTEKDAKKFAVVNLFDVIAYKERIDNDWFMKDATIVNDKADIDIKSFECKKNQQWVLSDESYRILNNDSTGSVDTQVRAPVFTYDLQTHHRVKLDFWSVMTDAQLDKAQNDLAETIMPGFNHSATQQKLSEAIDLYNRYNRECGKVISLPDGASKEQKDAYYERAKQDSVIKQQRAKLGKLKSSLTRYFKKNEGVDIDLAQYSL